LAGAEVANANPSAATAERTIESFLNICNPPWSVSDNHVGYWIVGRMRVNGQ
jgi:hypothetical protein